MGTMTKNEKVFKELVRNGILEVNKNGKVRNTITGTIYKGKGSDGYNRVNVSVEGKIYTITKHKLIWIVFKGNIPKGYQLNHKNGIKTCNKLTNLELVTHKGNMEHAKDHGLVHRPKEELNQASKLTKKKVKRARHLFRYTSSNLSSLCRRFNVSMPTMKSALLGDTWKSVPNKVDIDFYENKKQGLITKF